MFKSKVLRKTLFLIAFLSFSFVYSQTGGGFLNKTISDIGDSLTIDKFKFDINKLKEFNVNSIVKMASSYKFCVIATGEYDVYAAKERANEWDYAAGHAVAQNAGAIIKTLDEKPFLYGKEDYRNPSLLIKRAEKLDV